MKSKNLANNTFYRKWSNQRDEAAERLLDNTKRKTTEITDWAFVRAIEMLKARYSNLHTNGIPSENQITHFAHDLGNVFNHASHNIYLETIKLRKLAWMLSHVAEAVAVASVYKTKPVVKASKQEVEKLEDLDPKLLARILHRFTTLRNRIMQAIGYSLIHEEDVEKAVGRVYKLLPPRERLTSIRKLKRLTKVREADVPRDFEDRGSDAMTFSTTGEFYDWHFDPTTWQKIYDEYDKEYLYNDRSPAAVFDIKNPWNDEPIREDIPSNEAFYGWEVEQEVTHDFVTAVRNGEITAAKQNGVDDFLWIAILDKKTCEVCCEWRDGLTTKEIEAKLADSSELKEACDAIAPPAHFNCRCRVAPFSESLEPFEPDTDVELDAWMKSLL